MIPKPKTDNQEVLLTAIRKGYVDCVMFNWLSGFRARVSDLKQLGVRFTQEPVVKKNRYGHPMRIIRHRLVSQKQKDHALGIYLKLTKAA